jgi:predicted signal transduction protein with EAL and GGDEF domain
VRATDTVSRQGGDEFQVVLQNLADAEAAAPILAKMMSRLMSPCEIEGPDLYTSVSIGVTVYPDDGADFDTVMKKADMAMYRAKEGGRNTYRFFDEQMNVDAVEQLKIRSGLRRALEHSEFVLHYQPQIDLDSGEVIGAEALIRWSHPDLGMIYPGRFIQIAEDSGLIVPMGEWVLREACRQALEWRHIGGHALVMAVNLSAMQFKRSDLVQSVADVLAESGLEPGLLEL